MSAPVVAGRLPVLALAAVALGVALALAAAAAGRPVWVAALVATGSANGLLLVGAVGLTRRRPPRPQVVVPDELPDTTEREQVRPRRAAVRLPLPAEPRGDVDPVREHQLLDAAARLARAERDLLVAVVDRADYETVLDAAARLERARLDDARARAAAGQPVPEDLADRLALERHAPVGDSAEQAAAQGGRDR